MQSKKALFSVTFALLLLLTLTFAGPTALANDGDLDTTFDSDGKVTTDFHAGFDYATDIAIQPDGKIVAAGTTQITSTDFNFSLARYNSDGSPDTAFGANGKVETDLSSFGDVALAVALQADGKIVAAGYCENGSIRLTAIARYLPNGTLDATFGGGGKICGSFTKAKLSDVAIQADGKIVASSMGTAPSFSVVRFNTNGTLDNTFGVEGVVTTSFSSGSASPESVVLQADGKILVAGTADANNSNSNFALARYLNNGFLDTTFSDDGMLTVDFNGSSDFAKAMALATNGKIVLAGGASPANSYFDFGMVRVNTNGTLDTTFDGDGLLEIPIIAGSFSDYAWDVLIQPADGKVVAVGNIAVDTGYNIALVRVNANGTLDSTFGTNGKITNPFNGGAPYAYSAALQADGKIVTCGLDDAHLSNSSLALARFLSPLPPTATPTSTRTSTPVVTPTSTPTACPIEFTDVPVGSTYYDAVHCLACRGVVGGYTSGCPTGNPCFKPDDYLIRGDLAKIISNASGFTETYTNSRFEDVPANSAYFQFVERVSSRSIMTGFPCGSPGELCHPPANKPYFRPRFPVNRSDLARVVAKALDLPVPLFGQRFFEDVPQSSPDWPYIEALRSKRAIGGYPCGGPGEPCVLPNNRPYFRPNELVSRGQASQIVTASYFPDCLRGTNQLPHK